MADETKNEAVKAQLEEKAPIVHQCPGCKFDPKTCIVKPRTEEGWTVSQCSERQKDPNYVI